MAFVFPDKSVGNNLGQGLSQGLQTLASMKIKEFMQKQQENKFSSGLEALGYPKAQAQMLAPLLSSGFGGNTAAAKDTGFGAQKNILSRLIDYRKNIGNKSNKTAAMGKKLKASGVGENVLNNVSSGKLTDEMVDFLLKQTGNDPKKAKLIAQKMGFKV